MPFLSGLSGRKLQMSCLVQRTWKRRRWWPPHLSLYAIFAPAIFIASVCRQGSLGKSHLRRRRQGQSFWQFLELPHDLPGNWKPLWSVWPSSIRTLPRHRQ